MYIRCGWFFAKIYSYIKNTFFFLFFVFLAMALTAYAIIKAFSEMQNYKSAPIYILEKEVVRPSYALKKLMDIKDFNAPDDYINSNESCDKISSLGRVLGGEVVIVSDVLGVQLDSDCQIKPIEQVGWYNDFISKGLNIQVVVGDRNNPKVYVDYVIKNSEGESVGALGIGFSYLKFIDSVKNFTNVSEVDFVILNKRSKSVLGSSLDGVNSNITRRIKESDSNWYLSLYDVELADYESPGFYKVKGGFKWVDHIYIPEVELDVLFIYPLKYIWSTLLKSLTPWFYVLIFLSLSSIFIFSIIVFNRLFYFELSAKLDFLTGLRNRMGLSSFIKSVSEGKRVALCLIDIDDFKVFNDRYGHRVGDEAIKFAAKIISESEGDCFRIGGEEFLLLIDDENYLEKLISIRRRLCSDGFEFNGVEYNITASFGAVFCHGDNDLRKNYDGCFASADEALYKAKYAGKNRVCIIGNDGSSFEFYK